MRFGQKALADEVECLLLAEKIPKAIRRRVMERPDAFRTFATCDDETLDRLMVAAGKTPVNRLPRRRRS